MTFDGQRQFDRFSFLPALFSFDSTCKGRRYTASILDDKYVSRCSQIINISRRRCPFSSLRAPGQARPGPVRLRSSRELLLMADRNSSSPLVFYVCVHQLNCVRACVCVCVDLWRLPFLQFSFVCRCFSEFKITRLKSNKGNSSSNSSSQQKASHSHFFLIVVVAAVIRVLLSYAVAVFWAVRENERM